MRLKRRRHVSVAHTLYSYTIHVELTVTYPSLALVSQCLTYQGIIAIRRVGSILARPTTYKAMRVTAQTHGHMRSLQWI